MLLGFRKLNPGWADGIFGKHNHLYRSTNAVTECFNASVPTMPLDPNDYTQVGSTLGADQLTLQHDPGSDELKYWYRVTAEWNWPGGESALSEGKCDNRLGDTAENRLPGQKLVPASGSSDGWRIALRRRPAGGKDATAPTVLNPSPHRSIGQSSSDPDVKLYFYHLDHLGTPRVITDVTGQPISTHKYLPFGEELTPESSVNSHRFTGHERDKETRLDYMLARYYSPAGTFRFASVDPADESINPANPQTWNRYTYVLNNPLVLIDPSGEDLVVSGSQSAQDKFKATANSGLFGKETEIDADGNVTLVSNGDVGPPTPGQAALEDTLNEAISDSGTTSIALSEGSGSAIVGEATPPEIDMTDVQSLGDGPGVTAVGALGHEIKEQYEMQIKGQPRGTETKGAHAAGKGAEDRINGSHRGPQTQSLRRNLNGTVNGTITIPYSQGGKTTRSTLHVQGSNVVKVTRTKPK